MRSVAYISIFAVAFLCCQLSAQDVSYIIQHIQSEQANAAWKPNVNLRLVPSCPIIP